MVPFTQQLPATSWEHSSTSPGQRALSRGASELNDPSTGSVVRHICTRSHMLTLPYNHAFPQEWAEPCACMCFSSDPEFVSSAFIEQSADNPTGDDDKIYFFFNEVAKEYDFYTKVKVPRVARVCKVTHRLHWVTDWLFCFTEFPLILLPSI